MAEFILGAIFGALVLIVAALWNIERWLRRTYNASTRHYTEVENFLYRAENRQIHGS